MAKVLSGKNLLWLAAVGVLAGLVVLSEAAGWLVQWLWMEKLGYGLIFWRLLGVKFALFGGAFAVVFVYFYLNLRVLVKRIIKHEELREARELFELEAAVRASRISPGLLKVFPPGAAFLFGLFFGSIFYAEWDTFIRFRYGGAFGGADPLYGVDIGFYVFSLPFYELIQNNLMAASLMALAIASAGYLYAGAVRFNPRAMTRIAVDWPSLRHLAVMFLVLTAAWGWGYYLDRFGLLFSTGGAAFGAGYTDYHVVRVGLWVMFFATLGLGAFILADTYLKRKGFLYVGVGLYVVLISVSLVFLPSIIQQFQVQPNELELEERFIKYNIDHTRQAYMLDRIEEREYPGVSDLSFRQIADNRETLDNIRLWDWRPILQTYRQTQEIRAYYKFYEVDVDRYHLPDGGYRQVMLSARELEERLPPQARTWVNTHLQFTHGYGLAMSLVAGKVEEGLPEYLVEDLPPRASAGLRVDQPAIYYGEKTPGYRIVSTQIEELDYPKGDENVYTSYAGEGGVPMGGVLRRLLFAWHFSDVNILLSAYITPESRIQIWRPTQERVSRIAPFLRLDGDPYLVLSEGRLYWIQDAYTVSSHYPYSEPYQGRLNYIRNSVKAVVDAYDGSVDFYLADPGDPVIAAYARAFPGVFKPLEELSPDLKAHLRYPEDLFRIQVDKYRAYHMTIPQVFYNKEDLWTLPREKYAGSAIEMEPYYILMRLPGEKRLEYLIMTPVTPQNRDNMIAWLAGKSDFPDYGRIIVYKLPKERVIYGPIQIEAMIDQDAVISQQLSLWDQRGSRVIRGNLLVIPMEHSFIYVEPVYLIAEETNIPQLKRVIAVYGKNVVMEPTVEEAIEAVFGRLPARKREVLPLPSAAPAPTPSPAVPPSELKEAREAFERAQESLRKGQWEEFGKAMESLRKILEKAR
ncbi:MAG: UPF0182 family protein [Thermodesulfovibrionales bacterium]